MKVGNRVHVDFISESRTEFSNNHFIGDGVIDRIEDGYVFGRTDDKRTFACPVACAKLIAHKDSRPAFEAFFLKQPFYLQLKYIHGERLFDFDVDIGYRNLTVQIAYVCWCKGDKEFVI